MASEPITLFARHADFEGIVRVLREYDPEVEIDGSEDDWRNIVIRFGEGRDERTLALNYNSDYCSEPNWSRQMNGMQGYFSRFPETERKVRALNLISTFCCSFATRFDPEFDPEGDPRLTVVFDVAAHLDAVLFTPGNLRDAGGRILFGAGGEEDEDADAVWPRVLGEVPVTDPLGAAMHERSRPKDADEEDANEESEAPTAERVARRALALAAINARAFLERDRTIPQPDEARENLLDWVEEIGIEEEFEDDEFDSLHAPLGELEEQQAINFVWRGEGLAILAWALGRFEIPPHDQLVTCASIWQNLGVMNVETGLALLAEPALRPRAEIVALRNRLFAIHWRMRNFSIKPEPMDFVEFARTCWFGPLDISGLPIVDGDLALRGERIDRASEEVFSIVLSAAQERHHAANWLLQGPERYSQTSVST